MARQIAAYCLLGWPSTRTSRAAYQAFVNNVLRAIIEAVTIAPAVRWVLDIGSGELSRAEPRREPGHAARFIDAGDGGHAFGEEGVAAEDFVAVLDAGTFGADGGGSEA